MNHKNNLIAPNNNEKRTRYLLESNRKDRELQKENDKELDTIYVIKPKGTYGPPIRIRTNSITNVRKSAAKITRMMTSGMIPLDYGRSVVFALQQLSGLYKIEAELSVVEQIKQIKADMARLSESGENSNSD